MQGANRNTFICRSLVFGLLPPQRCGLGMESVQNTVLAQGRTAHRRKCTVVQMVQQLYPYGSDTIQYNAAHQWRKEGILCSVLKCGNHPWQRLAAKASNGCHWVMQQQLKLSESGCRLICVFYLQRVTATASWVSPMILVQVHPNLTDFSLQHRQITTAPTWMHSDFHMVW